MGRVNVGLRKYCYVTGFILGDDRNLKDFQKIGKVLEIRSFFKKIKK